MEPINVSIIGAGRVGSTIAYVLKKSKNENIILGCIGSRTKDSLDSAKRLLGPESNDIIFTTDLIECAGAADCLLLATPDDSIEKVTVGIFSKIKKYHQKYVIHFSGSKSLKVLQKAKEAGALTGCMHPVKSFASVKEAVKTIKGTVFGITYNDSKVKELMSAFIEIMEGSFIEVADQKKPIYHAACCVASNYLVALMDYAADLNRAIGIKPQDSVRALMGLVGGTVDNIKKMGTKKSLTGPIARGDVGTIEEHLENFKENDIDQEIYRTMGIKTSQIAYQNGWIEKKVYQNLVKILEVDKK